MEIAYMVIALFRQSDRRVGPRFRPQPG